MGRWTIKLELGGAPGDHRVHGSVHRLDPVDVRRDHFARRDLTARIIPASVIASFSHRAVTSEA